MVRSAPFAEFARIADQVASTTSKLRKRDALAAYLRALEDVADTVAQTSLCALGKTAPNPVLSTLRYFREEYDAHIDEKRCPAGVCRALVQYEIDPQKCTGCGVCLRACPHGAITGERPGRALRARHLDRRRGVFAQLEQILRASLFLEEAGDHLAAKLLQGDISEAAYKAEMTYDFGSILRSVLGMDRNTNQEGKHGRRK